MRRLCAWCGSSLGGDANGPISHGVCQACLGRLTGEAGSPLREFLGRLGAPVLVIDGASRMREANAAACDVVGKERCAVNGKLCGEVFDCVHAAEPGGCGNTKHCGACTLRRTVSDTFWTGRAHVAVPVVLTAEPARGGRVAFLFSTEKAGEKVLLRIDRWVD